MTSTLSNTTTVAKLGDVDNDGEELRVTAIRRAWLSDDLTKITQTTVQSLSIERHEWEDDTKSRRAIYVWTREQALWLAGQLREAAELLSDSESEAS